MKLIIPFKFWLLGYLLSLVLTYWGFYHIDIWFAFTPLVYLLATVRKCKEKEKNA